MPFEVLPFGVLKIQTTIIDGGCTKMGLQEASSADDL